VSKRECDLYRDVEGRPGISTHDKKSRSIQKPSFVQPLKRDRDTFSEYAKKTSSSIPEGKRTALSSSRGKKAHNGVVEMTPESVCVCRSDSRPRGLEENFSLPLEGGGIPGLILPTGREREELLLREGGPLPTEKKSRLFFEEISLPPRGIPSDWVRHPKRGGYG